MGNAVAIIGVALAISLLEGVWTWLLAASISEIVGQGHPSLALMGVVLFGAWLAARVLALTNLSLERRRWTLMGAGLAAAATAGTVQGGVLVPLQLVFGSFTPDLRGAGVTLFLLVAYLWGRGLALAVRVNREGVVQHIAVAASSLAAVLLFLPLADAVRAFGFSIVVVSFLLGAGALLLVQVVGAESRRLSRSQWAAVMALTSSLLVVGGGLLTGVLSAGLLGLVASPFLALGRLASPVVEGILLALGYLAQSLSGLLKWLSDTFGVDPETVQRAVQQAEQARPRLEEDPSASPPEVYVILVGVFLTVLGVAVIAWLFYRLVYAGGDDGERIREVRTRAPSGSLLGSVRALFRGSRGDGVDGLDPREAIRRHYRAFQTLMARAGLPRRPDQTAREYQRAVAEDVVSAELHVALITDAYILARYAPPETRIPDPVGVGAAVLRVRDALRARD